MREVTFCVEPTEMYHFLVLEVTQLAARHPEFLVLVIWTCLSLDLNLPLHLRFHFIFVHLFSFVDRLP